MGSVRRITLIAVLPAMLALGSLAGAQVPSLAEQQARLRSASAQSEAALARSQALERAAAGARDRATQARAQEAASAERIKAAEADIAAARARIGIVDRLLAAQRSQLAERQGPILRLIAALQSMARRPPVLGLVQPGSTEDMVHVRAVLGTALPLVERRTAAVRAELERGRKLRATAEAAVASLREGRTRLESERVAALRLEAEHRMRSRALGQSALIESDRALALGERAREIVEQMDTMGEAAEIQAGLLALPGPLPRPPQPGERPASLAPKPGNPAYVLPVAGQTVRGLGELSDAGVRARGLTLACARGAEVVAPAAGRIVYAGPFRGYGGVVIVDHGKGWTTLLAGLGGIGVRVGDQVAQGGRIGRAGAGEDPRVTVELRRQGRAMDLAQLLD
ncbi:murein hydrolase activator EnvC family protein [Sphingomonas sp. M1-B02]|uniref:murein hydrolase activator EnvC family protein n=1 Tax=Sphingomonas sp. M1-B02 TaxID=3114300 RepID=UPI00223FC1D9|nr:peptidoglycan DD-metalloendopeptidase family protein [Sphingomonas sp. S6-11]UZK65107.1 peptidoglycan DD-metalloendopeptidase family protein [Sphingomonas sp. S6-11]